MQSPVDETAKYPTDDEEKADEEAFSIIAFWNWERRNYFIKK
ncbi:replication protein [Staphylococcus haemolyticus]|nr:replication protein [Staphylococcus haemolyticus]